MEVYYNYILFWVCIFGLCLGSFYNVVILRSLNNESIVFPPSKCPKCNNKLSWWHNIPLLSFFLLKGKCYFCNEKISLQYPIVEFLTMLMFALTFIKFGISLKTLFAIFWLSGFFIMTVTDIKAKLVDCNIAIAITISALIYALISTGSCLNEFYGMLVGIFILEVIARSGYFFAGTRAMGEADTFVAASLGAIFGIQNILLVLLYSFVVAMVFIIPQFLYKQFKSGNKTICILSILFILSGLIFKSFNNNIIIMLLFIIIGLMLSVSILKSMHQIENRTYLPFVPALSISALYFLFM